MIMQQTLFIVILAVVIALALAYRWKKKTEKKMGNDLNALIEANDWRGVCRILRKQLIVWGLVLVLCIGLLVARIMSGGQFYTPIIVCAFLAWRFFKLVNLYMISYKNMKVVEVESEDNIPPLPSIEWLLQGCKVTHVDVPSPEIKQLWLDAYERGKQEGFSPVLLAVDSCFFESLDDSSEWYDETKRQDWQSKMLASNLNDGASILHERMEQVKEEYSDAEWKNDVVGTDEDIEPINDFEIEEGTDLYLVEVPVKEPWKVFAYVPFGDWNECPKAEGHMAIAKYWYEKHGACAAYISNDVVEYYLPSSVMGDTMPIAEEHLGYSADILQGNNLASLAAELKKSTVWLVGLGKLIKRIWKKYRWLSYAICIITFSTLYDYIHSIITHSIICFPMWIWGIIPVVTILIFFAKFGIKKKSIFLQVVLGCCFGIVVTGVLGVLFYTTNYWFTSSHTYHLDAYVVGKRYIQRRGGYRSWGLSKYYVNLKFIDNQETFRLDDSKVFKKINQGDSVCVNFVKGLYGINIIKDISPKNK